MKSPVVSLAVALVLAVGAASIDAQQRRVMSTSSSSSGVDKKVAALEARVRKLEGMLKKNGNNVTLEAPGTLYLRSGNGAIDARGKSVKVDAQTHLTLKAAGTGRLQSGGQSLISGAVVKVNGQRAATASSKVTGNCLPTGGPLLQGKIIVP